MNFRRLAIIAPAVVALVGVLPLTAPPSQADDPVATVSGAAWTRPMSGTGYVTPTASGHVIAPACTVPSQSETGPVAQSLDSQGTVLWSIGRVGQNSWGCPQSIADSAGNAYAEITTAEGDRSVESVNAEGTRRWITSTGGFATYARYPVIGNGSVFFIETDGVGSRVRGYSIATGQVTLTYSMGYSEPKVFATPSGLVVVNIYGAVTYLNYQGQVTASIDPAAELSVGRVVDASYGGGSNVFVALTQESCSDGNQVIVAKVSPTGVAWHWTNPAFTCATGYISATPNGGAVLTLYGQSLASTADITALTGSGSVTWQGAITRPTGSEAEDPTYQPRPVVDSTGVIGVASNYGENCRDIMGGCITTQMDFLNQADGTQAATPLIVRGYYGGEQYSYIAADAAITTGHVFLASNGGDIPTPNTISGFDVAAIGTDYQLAMQTLREQSSTPTPPVPPAKTYVALGDSYSSGEGNPPFDPSSAACDRSRSQAWPQVAARARSLRLVGFFACSGAKSGALWHRFNEQVPQLTALARTSSPTYVSATFGGNNIGFTPLLTKCVGTRFSCVPDVKRARGRLPQTLKELTTAYRAIKAKAPQSKVLAVGYPNIFSRKPNNAHAHCVWLRPSEDKALVNFASALDVIERKAAANAGVTYVSTLNTLKGHELCTGKSWINSIDKKVVTHHKWAGHPLPPGQNAMAAVVAGYLK